MSKTERELQNKIIQNKDAIIAQLEAEIRDLRDKLDAAQRTPEAAQ